MQTNFLSNSYQRSPIVYSSYFIPPQKQPFDQGQQNLQFSMDFNQRRTALANTVTTPRFYAAVGVANLFGFLLSHFARINIGKMMAAVNATLYLTNAWLQGVKTSNS